MDTHTHTHTRARAHKSNMYSRLSEIILILSVAPQYPAVESTLMHSRSFIPYLNAYFTVTVIPLYRQRFI